MPTAAMSALEPQMFEDVSAEPAFTESSELAELAVMVAEKYDEFGLLAANLRQETISIAYVWETKPFDPNKDEYKPHTIALVRKAPTIWRCLTGYDLVIQFRRWFWTRFTPEQREAVVFHELAHIGFKDGGLELRHHDLEEFSSVVRHFGPAIPGRRAFMTAWKEWEVEQLPPSSGNVDAETGEILDPLADGMALRAAKTLIDMGAEISVTYSPTLPVDAAEQARLDAAYGHQFHGGQEA